MFRLDRQLLPFLFALVLGISTSFVVACNPDEPEPPTREFTFKALGGVSMGAIGASFNIGFGDNHKKVDALVALGGPMDVAFFLGGIERSQLGGFCPLERLQKIAEADARDGTSRLNDPDEPELADCSGPVPGGVAYEIEQHFNHWYYDNSGGDFDRDTYLTLFHDLVLALGNPFYWNPESPVYPHPKVNAESLKGDVCANPVVIEGFFNKEYNPTGKISVITFCDGDEEKILFCNNEDQSYVDYCSDLSPKDYCLSQGANPENPVLEADDKDSSSRELWHLRRGKYDPCYKHNNPVIFGLALDLNGNGKRDYHEPILVNGRERFEDVGSDGCPDEFEDGKGGCCPADEPWCAGEGVEDPNGDNFDLLDNPLGSEGNRIWDEGEPFDDCGLDGVCGTGDYGEGNGVYDHGPNFQRFLDHDFRRRYLQMSSRERNNIAFYSDGGIRDIFNFGLSADHVHSAMRALSPDDSFRFLGFDELPLLPGEEPAANFNFAQVDYSKLGRNVFIRYGEPDTPARRPWDLDGTHVGTNAQAMYRFATYLPWLSELWSPVLGEPQRITGRDGAGREEAYYSEALGAQRSYGIVLPPGYDEEPDRRYPVLFFGHGYGMHYADMMATSLLNTRLMKSGMIHPMILVFPSGRCCLENPETGERDCRDKDEENVSLALENPKLNRPAYRSECLRGNFYMNRQGYSSDDSDNTAYGDAIFELMEHIDANYRTMAPMTLELD